MKKIYQTKLEEKGNCFEACLASLLEIDIKDIPSYKKNWYLKYNKWLSKYDLALLMVGSWDDCEDKDKLMPNVYAIVTGISPRGFKHSVIYLKDEMVHDPHPQNGGVLEMTAMIYIIPKEISLKEE